MAVSERASSFRYAPADWSESEAREWAESQGLDMDDDHWEVVYALQEYCSRHECNKYSVRELHDALDEKFHEKGGCRQTVGVKISKYGDFLLVINGFDNQIHPGVHVF